MGVSRGEYLVRGSAVEAELTFARGELADVPIGEIVGGVLVEGDGAACPGTLTDAAELEGDGVRVRARYGCEKAPVSVKVSMPLLEKLSHGHRHLAKVGNTEQALFRGNATLTGAAEAQPEARPLAIGGSMFAMGIEHILSGYDHLIFLFGLILVGSRVKPLLKVVTAFTLAHSVTLAAAALGFWVPSPRWIEPLIALSIAYVGIENLFIKNADKRWRITFPFGLIHGFGFAGALQEVSLSPAQLPVALVSFNLGVEAGQLAVLAVALPIVWWARKRPAFARYGVPALSALIAVPGLVWFVTRVIG